MAAWRSMRIIAPRRGHRVSRARRIAFGWLLTLAAIALFASLGTWQLRRMHQKQAMLDAAARVLKQRHAMPLAAAADVTRARDYDWAAGTGTFAATAPLLLDNQVRDGRAGVRVYRIFLPDAMDAGGERAALLVDLGWLPRAGDRALPRIAFPDAARAELRGLLAPPPATGIALGNAAVKQGDAWLLTRVDTAALGGTVDAAHPVSLAPRVLRLDPALPGGYARDLDILPNTLPPERHLGYAVQWYGLALAVLVTALVLTFRSPRR